MAQSRRRKSGAPTVLSLFTGAGGLDLGLEAAGFEVRGCVERDADCRLTIRANGSWPLSAEGDIEALDPHALLREFALSPGELSLVAGGPPCQPFSKSGRWSSGETARMKDPRAEAFRRYFQVVEAALPEVMLLENVRGLLAPSRTPDEESAVDVLQQALDGINARHATQYSPVVFHLEAADYGIPQRRERVFVIAHRDGLQFQIPTATHGPRAASPDGEPRRKATAWDAIGDLDVDGSDPNLRMSGRWAALLPSIPEGQNYLWHTDRRGGLPLFGWRTKYWSFLLKLAKDQPSWAIQAQPGPATGPFHWRNRRLSIAEMARLQTFPDHHEFIGSYASVRRQIGNAVPSAMGELLGGCLAEQFFGSGVRPPVPTLAPVPRDDCPPPEGVAQVPGEYLAMSGEHAAHPGPGAGPGVLARRPTSASIGD